MNSVEEKAMVLYKKLLGIVEQENRDIAESRIDYLEHYISQKVEILKDVEELKKEKQWLENTEAQKELSVIIKKIIDLNESSAQALRNMKNEIHHELSSLHKGSAALKAYNSRK